MLLPVRFVPVDGVGGLTGETAVPVAGPPAGAAGGVPEEPVADPEEPDGDEELYKPCQAGGTHSLDADELVVKPRRTRNIFMPGTCGDGDHPTRRSSRFRVS